jgi:hypothetical protein
MANTWKGSNDGDVVRAMLDAFHNKATFLKTVDRQHDKDFGVAGRKNSGSILIKSPSEYTVGTSAVVAVQDLTETIQTMTVATRANIAVKISSYERTMSLDDFTAEVANPAMARLAAHVESTILSDIYKYVWNLTGASTMATTPATLGCIANAGARLTYNCAPPDDRHLLLDPAAMAGVVGSVAAYFHKASEVERAFAKGYIGEAQGFKFWESALVPSHTNGTRTDVTPVCTIGGTVTVPTGGIVTDSATITMTAFPDGLTYEAGDVFTIADVYAVNPETKARLPHLMQFTVKTDETETGSGDMSPDVYPTPVATGARQNIEIASIGAKLVLNLTAGGSGAASAVYAQNLAYHRDAFTVAFASLPMPYGDAGKQAVMDNVSMRMWQFSDGVNDTHTTRFDVLYGWLAQRPQWACRVRG